MVNVILNCFHKKRCMFHKHGKNMSIKNHAENTNGIRKRIKLY